ncbi:HalX domain-containing protein [Halovenus aranensis]|uniref:HalX domain-containing protein n=1 Tax=Halovenus aranensis TaxID=890420 RepID=A0A1G8S807_9EURY|nr:response regulator [Halovenus aranensis]SDJ24905.1 HalX domain-containing protein [Halovenus aranensis]
MNETTADRPIALIVDDEKEVADAYALRLRGLCEVETAYDGETALSVIEDDPVDIVLLDRHMPGMSGDDVLDELDDRGFDGKIIMVTAIDPGFDVLDMPFDDYLCKPIDREDVRAAVRQQCEILGYELLGEYFGVESKRRVIAAEIPREDREDHDRYQEIAASCANLEQRVRRLLDDVTESLDEFAAIGREGR